MGTPKMAARAAGRKAVKHSEPRTVQSLLRRALDRAETAAQFYAAWALARGVIEGLCSIEDEQSVSLLRCAYGTEAAAVTGLIGSRSAYPTEVANKITVY